MSQINAAGHSLSPGRSLHSRAALLETSELLPKENRLDIDSFLTLEATLSRTASVSWTASRGKRGGADGLLAVTVVAAGARDRPLMELWAEAMDANA